MFPLSLLEENTRVALACKIEDFFLPFFEKHAILVNLHSFGIKIRYARGRTNGDDHGRVGWLVCMENN